MGPRWPPHRQDGAGQLVQHSGDAGTAIPLKFKGADSLHLAFRHDASREIRQRPAGARASRINAEC